MERLGNILLENENWLMGRILNYAKQHGYSAYTSTLEEAWRLSISGLTASIVEGIASYDSIPEMSPEEDFALDPIAQFGIVEAQRHRERGINLGMFLGLMKYYRQCYIDLIQQQKNELKEVYEPFITRVFDRIEIGFCMEWSGQDANRAMHELQINNRLMTNEKNKYLTIFESIPNPVIILNKSKKIDNMNLAAAEFFKKGAIAGSQYYCLSRDRQLEMEQLLEEQETDFDPSCFAGSNISGMLPWMEDEINDFYQKDSASVSFEKTVHSNNEKIVFRVKFSKSLDVSGKFEGIIIILEDITELRSALEEVRTLRGFVPICANCKKIRDDQGYWQQVEQYVQEHSEATFSHGFCPDCIEELYGDFLDDDKGKFRK